jgi:hypothetical protein
MILAHVAPGTEDFTLQSLLSSAANVDDPDTARDYQAQCRTIFEILTSDNDGDPPTICATIVTSFSRMAKILSQTAKVSGFLPFRDSCLTKYSPVCTDIGATNPPNCQPLRTRDSMSGNPQHCQIHTRRHDGDPSACYCLEECIPNT